jgi:PIN domain nuclease of toxin-antitoxin system
MPSSGWLRISVNSPYMDRALAHHRLSELPISREIVLHAVELPDIHNDPFDRILIATAQLNGMPLVSKDQTIARYPDIEVVW